MNNVHALPKKKISLLNWKDNDIIHILSSQKYSDDKTILSQNILNLIFCHVTKDDEEKLKVINMNDNIGQILIHPKNSKIMIIRLYESKIACHTFGGFQSFDSSLPLRLTCIYEKNSDSLMINFVDRNKIKNVTSSPINQEYFGHDIIFDFVNNDKVCGIEVLNASEYIYGIKEF